MGAYTSQPEPYSWGFVSLSRLGHGLTVRVVRPAGAARCRVLASRVAPRQRLRPEGGRLARDSPLLADALPKLGGMARAAVEQWGLDESRLLAWAAARRLPGIGVADVNLYRQEHPAEDLSAEMNGDLLGT